LSVGGLLATGGGLLMKIWTRPHLPIYIGGAISIVGIALLAYGSLGFAKAGARIVSEWDPRLLRRALTDAAPHATISIIQTSIPDITSLIGLLEDLLTNKDKYFQLRLLLLDYENAREVLVARVMYRVETPDTHVAEIKAQIDQFIRLKQRVDAHWRGSRSGAKLSLEIRLYSFLPFGSVFQIGTDAIFSGLFWNWTSSINGPMIAATDQKSKMWICLEKHVTTGWDSARRVFPVQDGDDLTRARPLSATQTSTSVQ